MLTVTGMVEAYADGVLGRLIAQSGYDATTFGRAMLAELEDRIYQSWLERHAWLDKGFSVRVTGTPAAEGMQTVVDLRNALVHGNGKLTDRQSRDMAALIALEGRLWRALAVRTERGIVHCSSTTGVKAIGAGLAYIRALDAEVRLKQPQVPI